MEMFMQLLSNRKLEEILSNALATDDPTKAGELLVDFICEISLAKKQSVEEWGTTAEVMQRSLHGHSMSAQQEPGYPYNESSTS